MELLTQDKDFFPPGLPAKLRAVRAAGFDGLEIDGRQLLHSFADVQRAMRETGVAVPTACGGYRGWIGDFNDAKRRQCLDDLTLMLQRLAALNPGTPGSGVVVPGAWGMFSLRLPPMVPPRSPADDEAALLDSLGELNDVAGQLGQTLFLEPLNRYEDHLINTVARARYYIEKGAFQHVRIIADCFHMNIEEASTVQTLRDHADLIQHVHFADNQRYEPGSGQLDFRAVLDALHKTGYAGRISFECRVVGTLALEAYQQSVAYVRGLITNIWGA